MVNTDTSVVGFIGLGLIGGSLAKAIRKFHPKHRIMAYSATPSTLEFALSEGIIDESLTENDDRFSQCDYIFLCAPVSENIHYLPFLKSIIKDSCIISDVGSVKGPMMRAAEEAGLTANFIGGHPMAGSEKTGILHSSDYMVENAYYILTPGGDLSLVQLSDFIELIQSIGAIPMVLTDEEHDYITAAISHLPQIVATSLVTLVHDLDNQDHHMKTIAAGGFKDITRIASSSPDMWQPICAENRKQLSKVLDSFIRLIVKAKYWIDEQEAHELYQLFSNARDFRNSFPDHQGGGLKKEYFFYCDIYDEAGGIATVATMLATNGISIKNIGIVHNREFGEGVLRIEFYDLESCQSAEKILSDRNYTLHFV